MLFLFRLTQGLLNTNLRRIKLHFNFLSRNEKIILLNEALSLKLFHVIFELFTENPGLLNRLNKDKIPLLIKKAIMSREPTVISIIIDEGHLSYLNSNQLFDIFEEINSYGFPEKIVSKLEDWFSWFKRGYIRFRSCYIHKEEVEILQEIERTLDIKLIWTPYSLALSNYMFEIDDEQRISELILGTQIIKEIPSSIIEKIHTLKNLKGLM